MPDKDPFNMYPLVTYLWVLGLSVWGGAVNFFRKVKTGEARAFNIPELIGELVTSAFTGFVTFWLCQSAGFSAMLTAPLVGISGHMGSRAIFHFEKWLEQKVNKL